MSRAPKVMREPHVPFALKGVETLERQNDALFRLQPLEYGAGEQFTAAFLNLVLRDAAGEQRPHPTRCERRAAVLHNSLGEPRGLRRLCADDDEEATGQVT